MPKFLLFISLPIFSCLTYADSAMQPPLMVYEHCDKKGLVCSGETEFLEGIDSTGHPFVEVSSPIQANGDLLLNLEHYYSNECKKELGIDKEYSVPKEYFRNWSDCVIGYMSNAVQERNQQNIKYVEKLKNLLNE